jgi:hypothetical protein
MLDVHRELELHVANTCNLSCESCSHFSNDGHRGMLAPEEADSWMRVWNKRIRPEYFCLLGGEPTMNPKLVEIVLMAGRNWPESQVSLTTNGFFLEKHPKLPAALQQVRAHLLLSVHHNAPEYVQLLDRPVRLLREWQRQYKFSVYFNDSYHNWTRRYRGRGEAVMPFADNDPRSSWENCRARFCRQLFRGRIWKCSTIAYLQLQKERYPAISGIPTTGPILQRRRTAILLCQGGGGYLHNVSGEAGAISKTLATQSARGSPQFSVR